MPRKKRAAEEVVKMRKPYPSREERIAMAEAKIARLEKLNATRRDLIARTEATLTERKTALEKTEAVLEKEIVKRDRLIAGDTRPARSAEKEKMSELIKLLADSGKSLDELIEDLKK